VGEVYTDVYIGPLVTCDWSEKSTQVINKRKFGMYINCTNIQNKVHNTVRKMYTFIENFY